MEQEVQDANYPRPTPLEARIFIVYIWSFLLRFLFYPCSILLFIDCPWPTFSYHDMYTSQSIFFNKRIELYNETLHQQYIQDYLIQENNSPVDEHARNAVIMKISITEGFYKLVFRKKHKQNNQLLSSFLLLNYVYMTSLKSPWLW
jgi:hypothetical protein